MEEKEMAQEFAQVLYEGYSVFSPSEIAKHVEYILCVFII